MAHNVGRRVRSVIDDDTERTVGQDAQRTNIAAGSALADLIRTTLGPKGLDTMTISDGSVLVTNNGYRVLDRLQIDHPAAAAVAEAASEQRDHVGDGTTTVVTLTGALLARAETLLDQGLHGTAIANGYRRATRRALAALDDLCIDVSPTDDDRLTDVAETVITGRWDSTETTLISALTVEAARSVTRDGRFDRRQITTHGYPGAALANSELIDGLVVDLDTSSTALVSPGRPPDRSIGNATIALIDGQLTIETVDGLGSLSVDGAAGRQELLDYEDGQYANQVEIIAETGADVVCCQQGIDDTVRYLLAKRGVLAIERTRRDEFSALARATGATPAGSVEYLRAADTGQAGRFERRTIADRELAIVRDGRTDGQVSLVLRGGPAHVVEELERITEDCFAVLELAYEDGRLLPGGGASETHLARILREAATSVDSREALAVEAFADALESVPRTLARTAGFDPVDSLLALRHRHAQGAPTTGLALDQTGGEPIADMIDLGVLEPFEGKRHAIASAEEVASMLVRIDDVIRAAPDPEGNGDGHDHDHTHGSGGVQSTGGYPWAIGH